MCDISKKTNLKRKVVYKVVFKRGGVYYSVFAYTSIKKGTVPLGLSNGRYIKGVWPYNSNMEGRVSGFASKKSAISLVNEYTPHFYQNKTILRMVLGGNIMCGTAKYVLSKNPGKRITYAGTEIIDFEEITI